MSDPVSDVVEEVKEPVELATNPVKLAEKTFKEVKRPINKLLNPKVPELKAKDLPTPPPKLAREGAIAAESERRKRGMARGRASNILAGSRMNKSERPSVAVKTLLGE